MTESQIKEALECIENAKEMAKNDPNHELDPILLCWLFSRAGENK